MGIGAGIGRGIVIGLGIGAGTGIGELLWVDTSLTKVKCRKDPSLFIAFMFKELLGRNTFV